MKKAKIDTDNKEVQLNKLDLRMENFEPPKVPKDIEKRLEDIEPDDNPIENFEN